MVLGGVLTVVRRGVGRLRELDSFAPLKQGGHGFSIKGECHDPNSHEFGYFATLLTIDCS